MSGFFISSIVMSSTTGHSEARRAIDPGQPGSHNREADTLTSGDLRRGWCDDPGELSLDRTGQQQVRAHRLHHPDIERKACAAAREARILASQPKLEITVR